MNKFTLAATVITATLTLSTAAFAASAVATTDAKVRDYHSTSADWIDTLYAGEVVDVLDCTSSWCYVDHYGPSGWVKKSQLSFCGYAPDAPHVGFGFSVDGSGVSWGFNLSSY